MTGSKYLLEVADKKILIDCGLFQGLKELRLLNWQDLPIDPSTIDAILLTHGHLDHTGYLPRLVKNGFRGPIFGSEPTLEVTKIILKDSANIQEEEAENANKKGYSKHKPALPLYTMDDVEDVITLFSAVPEGKWVYVLDEIEARFNYNGHILGATFIELQIEGKTYVFSGDIGRQKDLILHPPKKPTKADVLLIESTYGGRVQRQESEVFADLAAIVNKTIDRGGTLLIPSFAVERTQLLMFMLWQLLLSKKIPEVPMIVDSPMGLNMLELFFHTHAWHTLSRQEVEVMCSYFRITHSYSETIQWRANKKPKIVLAGSGMVTGGRILTYLQTYLEDPSATLLFAGYQAAGTRGRKILEGASDVKIYGKRYPVKLEIAQLDGLSAHADQAELLDWMSELKEAPKSVYVVHGEPDQAEAFAEKIRTEKGWSAVVPKMNQTVML